MAAQGSGNGAGPQDIVRFAMRRGHRNASFANPYLRQLLLKLMGQSNEQFGDEQWAQRLGPRMDALDRQFDSAQGGLDQDLAARGIDQSSAMVGGQAALAGQAAQARSGMISDVYGEEETRQRQAQAMLQALLQDMVSGGQGAAQLGLQQQQLDMQRDSQSGGIGIGDIIGGMFGLGGAYLGRPRAPKSLWG